MAVIISSTNDVEKALKRRTSIIALLSPMLHIIMWYDLKYSLSTMQAKLQPVGMECSDMIYNTQLYQLAGSQGISA